MVQAAWQPIPELKTWVGTFGQAEATMQEKILQELVNELGIDGHPAAWLRYRDADRLLQRIQNGQKNYSQPWIFKANDAVLWGEFYWPPAKGINRVKKLIEEVLLEKVGDDTYQLSNWQEHKRR